MDPSQLRVLYEDDALLAVEKPAGVHTAPLAPGEAGTLLAAVIARYPEVAGLPGRKPVEPGLLHRLDRETSGVVVVARTPAAFEKLRAQFESGKARKEYVAGCGRRGLPGRKLAVGDRLGISSRFAPSGPGRKRVRVVEAQEGREHLLREATSEQYATEAEVLAVGPVWCAVRCLLTRGFRHQVRAHLAWMDLPILGDPLYGVAAPDGPSRMYLHAAAIELAHPTSGEPLRIESPLPPELAALLAP